MSFGVMIYVGGEGILIFVIKVIPVYCKERLLIQHTDRQTDTYTHTNTYMHTHTHTRFQSHFFSVIQKHPLLTISLQIFAPVFAWCSHTLAIDSLYFPEASRETEPVECVCGESEIKQLACAIVGVGKYKGCKYLGRLETQGSVDVAA